MKNIQAVGIDIGKEAIHVALADSGDPKKYPVTIIDLTRSNWWHKLLALVAPPAIIAAEPTGWHYFKPIITALEMHPDAHLIEVIQINHEITASVRRASFGKAKNDTIDARAIAHIAANRDKYIGWKIYNHNLHTTVHSLRLLINEHRRLTKQSTRRQNQLDALGHSVWPTLAQSKSTWYNCIELGAIDPAEIVDLIGQGKPNIHGSAWYHIQKKFADLPLITANQYTRANIVRAFDDYYRLQIEINNIEAEIEERVMHPDLREITEKWLTVPAITPIGAAKLHVATDGLADQISISAFKAAVGVAPTTGISGSIDRTANKRGGYRPAKDVLFQTVRQLLTKAQMPNPIAAYYSPSKKNSAACRRKLAGILSGIARNPSGKWKP